MLTTHVKNYCFGGPQNVLHNCGKVFLKCMDTVSNV